MDLRPQKRHRATDQAGEDDQARGRPEPDSTAAEAPELDNPAPEPLIEIDRRRDRPQHRIVGHKAQLGGHDLQPLQLGRRQAEAVTRLSPARRPALIIAGTRS